LDIFTIRFSDKVIDVKNFDWKRYITECLNSTGFCTVATREENGVWANPVYFAYDDKFNIYYISPPNARHMRNTRKDGRCALTIFSTNFSPDGDVWGVYIEGKAVIVPDREVENAYKVYFKRRFPKTGKDEDPPLAYKGGTAAWKFVKIVPLHVYYFDTRFFDEVRQEVPMSKLCRT